MTTLEKLVAASRESLACVLQDSATYANLVDAIAAAERELAASAHDPPTGVALPPMETAVEQIPAPAVDRETLGRAAYEAYVNSDAEGVSWCKVADAVIAAAGRQVVDVDAIRKALGELDGGADIECTNYALQMRIRRAAKHLESALAPAQGKT